MVEKPAGKANVLKAYFWALDTTKEMKADGVTGSVSQLKTEFWTRVLQTFGEDPDWIAILLELLPLIIAILQMFLAAPASVSLESIVPSVLAASAMPVGGMFPEFEPRHAFVAAMIAGRTEAEARNIAKLFRDYRG